MQVFNHYKKSEQLLPDNNELILQAKFKLYIPLLNLVVAYSSSIVIAVVYSF
jgi:hypothetical protein